MRSLTLRLVRLYMMTTPSMMATMMRMDMIMPTESTMVSTWFSIWMFCETPLTPSSSSRRADHSATLS